MTWTAALKEYAKVTGKFIVPKKGSPEHAAVVKLQNKLKGIPDPEEVKQEKVKKERKKKEEATPKPPTEEEIKKKQEEDNLLKEQAGKKAIEDAANAKKAKKAEAKALVMELKKKNDEYKKVVEEAHIKRDKVGAEDITMKSLKNILPTKEEVDAHKELSINKKKERADKKLEKKLAVKQRGEPTFRIEDKQIIISFKE
jgi:hypothetical protein